MRILGRLIHARCSDCGADLHHVITDDDIEAGDIEIDHEIDHRIYQV